MGFFAGIRGHFNQRLGGLNIRLSWPRVSAFRLGVFLALLVGVVSGLGAVGFRYLLDLFHFLFFGAYLGSLSPLGKYAVVLLPATGGLGVGLLVYFFAREARGHGVPEVMLAVSRNGGRIRGRVAIVKALASAVCISSGGSVGREGPIVQIGSAAASFLGQRFGVSSTWLRVLVACGAAGGISATFNAPIAGVFFALEVVLRTFSVQYFGLVVISSVVASVISQMFLGNAPAFAVPFYALKSPWELGLYVLLGILSALLGLAFMRFLYYLEDRFEGLSWIPEYIRPVLGGAGVGAIGIYYPQIFGVGYESMSDALTGNLVLQVLIVLALMKILATALTLGSGGSGGIFAPSLFIGAMAGTAYGQAVGQLFPGATGPAGAYGLVGMAAVFSGAAWAPITAIIIVFEMTRDYNIILPLMLAVVVSTFLSRTLSRESIYTLKLRRRGIDLQVPRQRGLFDSILVGDIMARSYPYVYTDSPVKDLAFAFESNGVHGLPVLNPGQELVGIVTATDVEHAISDGYEGRTAYDIATRSLITAYQDQSLSEVVTQPGAQEVGYIPVVDREDHKKLLGVLRRQDMISAYANARNQPPTPDDEMLR